MPWKGEHCKSPLCRASQDLLHNSKPNMVFPHTFSLIMSRFTSLPRKVLDLIRTNEGQNMLAKLTARSCRTYEDACQELSAVLRPSQNLGKNPYGEGMQSGFDLDDAELDSEGSQASQGADAAYESDSEESILFPSLASTPSASMSVVSFSEINDSAPQLPSLEEEVGDFEYNGEAESLQSSKDSHDDWEILSDMDSWDEIFEHSDLIPADLY